ncbi:MmgE/PrpD family protein [Limibacillus halophilus]|uniref:2-methylcitrate dehydratase PrpD n=1 Tax=Limibacillus halophilus TaxID=1579333 RepID=A0A839SP63_9PROT|nr:MmgE/PrpD family protein [Limibacillus halophilus]MBB3064242.1 2-methylcitrate dehydratase PrpD [Limibacillus halophilus]
MPETATLAEKLAGFTTRLITEGCDDAAMSRAKTYALDTLAVTLGGAMAESSKRTVSGLTRFGSGGPSAVFGSGLRLSCGEAALANGTLAHALELDDDHRIGVLHPGAAVVPAAFAIAEASGASGRDFLLGLIAGYEVACRLGEVFRGSLFRYGFHPTALCGALGAAAAGAVVLRLDSIAATRALGIAGTQAAGLVEWRADGSWIKRLHPGRAAQSGVIAALLAAEGFTGPATILEGAGGFFAAFGHDQKLDTEAVTRGLGTDLRGLGTAIKPYPCCRFAHGAIDLALEAQRAGIAVQDISEVEVRLYRTDVLTYHPVPINAVDAQFNVPYHIACCLLQGNIGLKDFTVEAVQRPEILALAAKVKVVEDDALSALYPEEYHTVLRVKTLDREVRQFLSTCPSGDPEADRYKIDSSLFDREAMAKTRSLLSECGYGNRVEKLIQLTDGLDTARDLSPLSELLGQK